MSWRSTFMAPGVAQRSSLREPRSEWHDDARRGPRPAPGGRWEPDVVRAGALRAALARGAAKVAGQLDITVAEVMSGARRRNGGTAGWALRHGCRIQRTLGAAVCGGPTGGAGRRLTWSTFR